MPDPLTPTIVERATYIAETCAELYRLAGPPRLRTLSYLIDMARIEAERIAKDVRAEERKARE